MSVYHSARTGDSNEYDCGYSNEYSKYTIFNIKKKKKTTLNYPDSAAMGYFQGTQERVRNSRGKRAISVRADLLAFPCLVCEPVHKPGQGGYMYACAIENAIKVF